jgi:hypothetical protein
MEIVHRTPERLVVVHRPWFLTISTWIVGASAVVAAVGDAGEPLAGRTFAVLAGLAVMAVAWRLMPFHTLDFNRGTGQFVHRMHRVSGTQTRALRLDEIDWAKVEARWNENARGERLVLATRDGTYAVETGFGPAKRTPVADAINDWLTAPEPGALNSPRAW